MKSFDEWARSLSQGNIDLMLRVDHGAPGAFQGTLHRLKRAGVIDDDYLLTKPREPGQDDEERVA